MPNPYFQFKQFTIWHDKCAMKVGTDGVLLGAWTKVESARNILDIGTGTGLVALMLAQRSTASIVGVEVDESATLQATENAALSMWKERIEIIRTDFKAYASGCLFDCIVSNPPYFVNSLPCTDKQRNAARHNDSLTYEDLIEGVAKLLLPEGAFTIVVPADALHLIEKIAAQQSLYPDRLLHVTTTSGMTPKRVLIAFKFGKRTCLHEELLIEISRHQYSKEYIALTKEYYLNM